MYANGKQKMVAWVGGGFVNRTWTFSTKQNKTKQNRRTEENRKVVVGRRMVSDSSVVSQFSRQVSQSVS